MAQYMKKNRLGRLSPTDNINDPDVVEIRLTRDEYTDLLNRAYQAEQRLDEINEEVEEDVAEIYRDANRQLDEVKKQLKDNAETAIRVAGEYRKEAEKKAEQALAREEKIKRENEDLKERLDKASQLNESLQRISRERSNSRRGLKPKKEHKGYVIIYSTQSKENNQFTEQSLNVWQTLIQTPYDAVIPFNQVKDNIMGDMKKQVLADIGIQRITERDKYGNPKLWLKKDQSDECELYKWGFKANYREGLWELTLYTTKALTIPEEYINNKEKVKKHKKNGAYESKVKDFEA